MKTTVGALTAQHHGRQVTVALWSGTLAARQDLGYGVEIVLDTNGTRWTLLFEHDTDCEVGP